MLTDDFEITLVLHKYSRNEYLCSRNARFVKISVFLQKNDVRFKKNSARFEKNNGRF